MYSDNLAHWMSRWIPAAALLALLAAPATAGEKLSFNRDIRSILSNNCFACHGPDESTRESGLRLDTRAGALGEDGGPAAIDLDSVDDSELLARITSDDEDLRMPPVDTGKQLSADEVARLRQWISEGATYEPHWSFVPPRQPELPAVRDSRWASNAIDHFILVQLESNRLAPSPEADRATLIRRLYLDLLGVLPTPAEVAAFETSKHPQAYEELVDRLLANPHFGERWGRHWLDQARYADSNGYAIDEPRTMWPYRDWVIDAFNKDLPFDQFTIEQLAGDLLDDPTLENLVATGFHRNTLINNEGGTKADQFRVEQNKDRIDTTGSVWLALSVGCAQCHTHKYDPIEHREYYQLYAFFDSLQDQNSVAPTIKAHSPIQRQQIESLSTQIAAIRSTLEVDDEQVAARRAKWEAGLVAKAPAVDPDWKVLAFDDYSSKHGATFETLADDSIVVGGANRPDDRYTLRASAPITTIRSLRLELRRHESLPLGGPGRASNGNIVLSELRLLGPDGQPRRFAGAWADHSQPRYDVAGAIDDNPKTGWAINNSPEGGANQNRVAHLVLAEPLELNKNDRIVIEMEFHNGTSVYNVGGFRLSAASAASPHFQETKARQELAAIATLPIEKRSAAQQQQLDHGFAREDPVLGPAAERLTQLEAELQSIEKSVPSAMVLRELAKPRTTHIHLRGDFLRPGLVVEPNVPAILPALYAPSDDTPSDDAASARATRLDLARWLVRDDHPLTARVRVNRVWMRLFGDGLVETENDFGTQGSPPTHPELLDWLAIHFREQGWSTKQLIRLMVNSSTYRQSSQMRADLQQADPQNLLLGRQNRVRVEAEIVRDLALSAAGLLSPKIGGPSVFPPQPDGVYSFTQTNKSWKTSQGEDRYRRGMYTFFYRSAPHPMLSTFDVPNFNQTCTRRDRSNTPLQSLTMANDEALVEAAQALALRILSETSAENSVDAASRVERMFRTSLCRTPTEKELSALLAFFTAQQQHFAEREEDAQKFAPGELPTGVSRGDAAAWTATARVLLNLDEMITRE